MKLKELEQNVFQHNKEINFDVSQLYFDYGDKEIYDLLKQNVTNHIILNKVKALPTATYWSDINNFRYVKNQEIIDNYNHMYFTLINSLTENEQKSLMDYSLAEKEKNFAKIMLENPEVKLTEEQFNTVINMTNQVSNWCYTLRKALIENKNIPLTAEQVNEGVLKWDGGLNISFASRSDNRITKETIDILINDQNEDSCFNDQTLVALLKNKNLQLTEEQIEFFLSHDDFRLRAECARNYQLSFTKDQIKRGLDDEGFEYDGYDDTYSDYDPSDVINAFLQNPNIKITKKEVNSLLQGYNEHVNIELLVQEEHIKLDEKQIDIILDKNDRSSALLLQNKAVHLNDQQLLKVLYKDKYWPKYVAENYLNREDVTVSEVVLSVLKIHPSEEIQKVVSQRGDTLLSRKKTKPKM